MTRKPRSLIASLAMIGLIFVVVIGVLEVVVLWWTRDWEHW
jgi:hypothetical protein